MTARKPCTCGCGALAKADRNYVAGHKPTTIAGRIMAKVAISPTGCWEWTGANAHGYGHITIAGRVLGTHRVMYEEKVGSIPDGLHLDHLCRNPPCCNPDHLEPVTALENIHRGTSPKIVAHLAGTCTRGHDLATYAYRRKSTGQVVYCRACRALKAG